MLFFFFLSKGLGFGAGTGAEAGVDIITDDDDILAKTSKFDNC